MAAEWYYTTNKQQMGPVSWDELRQLATQGLLKPNDLVWTGGMAEWVKATGQAGLFSHGDSFGSVRAARVEVAAPPPPLMSPTRRRIDDELDRQEREDRQDRRKDRQGGGGLKVGLTIGGVLLGLLLFLGCGGLIVGGIIWYALNEGSSANQNYTVSLVAGAQADRTIRAKAGQRVQIVATTPNAFPPPNIGVQILRNGNVIVNPLFAGGNSTVNWTPPATDRYVVRIINRGPGFADTNVRITFN